MAEEYKKFYIGITIFVLRNNKLLLGKRKNMYGAGSWGLPGGHLEYGESMKEAAARELKEETGLKAKKLTFINLIDDLRKDQHYLQIGFLAKEIKNTKPALKEPDRTEEWKWFYLNNLPKEIFVAHIKQIKAFREKKYFL